MAGKQIRVSRRMLFTWLMLAGFIFLLFPQSITNKFQFAFARIFRWPLGIGRNISLSTHTQQSLKNVVSRREFNQLQNHLANVRAQLLQERQKRKKLSGLHSRFAWENVKFVLADIITASIDTSHSKLVINRGKNDGLDKGQFVLGDNSIIGTICDTSSRTAKVRLITDPASKIPVKIAGLNLDMIMQGNGRDSTMIQFVTIKHKVRTGSIVYTLQKPGFLDTPMIVGTVAQYKRSDENPSLWDITVKPACNIETLRDVAVIVMNPQE